MKKRIRLVVLLIPISFLLSQSQTQKIKPSYGLSSVEENAATKSSIISTPLYKEINPGSSGNKWAISVRPSFSTEHCKEEILKIKENKLTGKLNSYLPHEESQINTRAVNPAIATNFEANWSINKTPPDNTMAISNGGYIVSANNDGIEYYNTSGSYLYFDYWFDFFNDASLTAKIYDPKVIYDSGADRFVLILLHGSISSTSTVLVSFSKSNNPLDGWWTYQLTGDPLNAGCWFDYPSLGVSNNEIYISGNLYFDNDDFNQSVIYQIPKAAGYAAGSLDWQYWSDLSALPYEAFSLVPASYGHQGNYGPGIYFVSNDSGGADKIRLWDLTDDLDGNPQLNSYIANTTAYSPAADALQSGSSDKLDNGDCRIISAFYLNGIVHFVFHSDIGDGWNGINYNRLSVSNNTIESSTFGLRGSYDYSYPAVVPFSTSITDKSVMIAFLRSSSDSYPQVRVVNCDQNLDWSPSALIKGGETFVDILDGDERWGDYTGIARRQNSLSGRIWLAGCYGADITSQQTYNTFKTWIAEIYAGSTVAVKEVESINAVSIFPNPAYDLIHITFTLEQREMTIIELLDMQGKVIHVLYRDVPAQGENKLTFNKGALSPGMYLLSIKTNTKILKNETIIIN